MEVWKEEEAKEYKMSLTVEAKHMLHRDVEARATLLSFDCFLLLFHWDLAFPWASIIQDNMRLGMHGRWGPINAWTISISQLRSPGPQTSL
jgi:hypothetical protein